MPEQTTFNLADVKDPEFRLKLPDGSERVYNPLDIAMRLEESGGDMSTGSLRSTVESVRRIFGFPTPAEVAAAPDPKPWTPSETQCLAIVSALVEHVEGLECTKKVLGPKRN